MNLKLQWMTPGATVDDHALCFGFDSSAALFANPEHALDVDWLKAGDSVKSMHNLVILGVGPNRYKPDFTKWDKGELADGTARYVYPIFNHPSLPFRAGLTLHATRGTWSSLPHEFEREEILTPRPMPFYEKFAYVTEEPGGWGIQTRIGHLFTHKAYWDESEVGPRPDRDRGRDWVNDTVTIRDRDILDIPLGSHPVCFGPGVRGGYLWVFVSDPLVAQAREKFTKDKAL